MAAPAGDGADSLGVTTPLTPKLSPVILLNCESMTGLQLKL